jgi:predicted O-methyltransferase YrrM
MTSITDHLGRNELAKMFKGIGAEIGVEQGVFAEEIMKTADKLYCVDAWQSYRAYRDHVRQSKLDAFYDITKNRLDGLNVEYVRKFSVDAAKDFADGSLDFVYIDANHSYEYVKQDIELWAPKVKSGGIVSGHDYIRRKGQSEYYNVVPAVNEYVAANNLQLYVFRGDHPPSWAFIKP